MTNRKTVRQIRIDESTDALAGIRWVAQTLISLDEAQEPLMAVLPSAPQLAQAIEVLANVVEFNLLWLESPGKQR